MSIKSVKLGRPSKANPLTPAQRQDNLKAKRAKFGVKRVYFYASTTERRLIERLAALRGDSKGAVIAEILREEGARNGIYLKDLKEDSE